MMAEEDEAFVMLGEVPANKKLTLFLVDGSEKMFKGDPCPFVLALKVVYHQMMKVCCSGSFTHMMGVVITNTVKEKSRFGQRFCYELIEMNYPSRDDIMLLKNIIESDIQQYALEHFGGHAKANLANIVWMCKKIMTTSAISNRHHIIMYITNDPNPFDHDPRSYIQLQKIVLDFCMSSYMDKNGVRKANKTPGGFHVLMMEDKISEDDRNRWTNISSSFFTGDLSELELHAYKKVYSQRAFSIVNFEIGPGINLGVSVYTLLRETVPPTKVLLDPDTEMPLQSHVTYASKPNNAGEISSQPADDDDNDVRKKNILEDSPKKPVQYGLMIGGEQLTFEKGEFNQLINSNNCAKIALLGFLPVSEVKVFEEHVGCPQFINPNESLFAGSTRLFNALHKKCTEREVAMICRFNSRLNQKIRLVALIPENKKDVSEDIDEEHQDEMGSLNDYRNFGFYVVYLPYEDNFKNLEGKLQCPFDETGKWPSPETDDVSVTRKFIKNLTRFYVPEKFYNPRLKSFNAMLIQAAVGDEVEKDDTILPYHKTRPAGFVEKLTRPLLDHFKLNEEDIPQVTGVKRSATSSISQSQAKKKVDTTEIDLREFCNSNQLNQLTVAKLKSLILENNIGHYSAGAKKADLIRMITEFYV